MKILFVTQRFSPVIGGAEQVAQRYVDFLSKNHDVTVYTSNAQGLDSFWNSKAETVDENEERSYAIKRYPILVPEKVPENLQSFPFSISVPGPFCPDMWRDLLDMKDKFDLIVATSLPYDHVIPAFVSSKKYKIPLVIIPHLHLEFPELYLTGLKLALLAESSSVVVNTVSEKQALLNYGVSPNLIHVIPPGILTESKNIDTSFRMKLGIKVESIVILFAGTKSPSKGIINLLESFKILQKKFDNLELILIGSSTSEFENYMTKQNKEYLEHIHDLGIVSEEVKWNVFACCDIFALPSRSESFGISYLEAWFYKIPVIGCKIQAVSDLIDDGKDGILIDFGDISQMCTAIEKLLDKSLRMNLGEHGFVKLAQKYDSAKLCKEFENVCISICSH